jgi:anaerobic carbon-monoxide dehydrogenase iron sulfur subunit
MKRLNVNPVPCTGCLCCETACSLVRSGGQDRGASACRVALDIFGGVHTHVFCRQCDAPSCAAACPAGAITRNGVSGAWVVDTGSCILCGICVEACPFGAMGRLLEGQGPVKCDLCGGEPRCALACSFGAIRFLEPDSPDSGFIGMPSGEQDPLLGRGPREVPGKNG